MLVRINGSWTVFGSTTQATFPTQADLAEYSIHSGDAPQAGDVLVIAGSEKVTKSQNSYDTNLIGIVSTDPHTTMGTQTDRSVRLGLAGRVPVKIASGSAAHRAR